MVGIIILNFNSSDDTIKCVRSIQENTSIKYRIYIVDGCSSDNSYAYLSDFYRDHSNVELLKSDINGGYSYGNNLGAIEAIRDGADAILIINPDVVVTQDAINLMYETLINDDTLAVVGPKILSIDEVNMQFASKLYTLKGFLYSKKPIAYFGTKRINKSRFHSFDTDKDFCFQGMVSGCCFMIKAYDFESIGFFDTNVFLYYEEDILAYKLLQIKKLTKILANAVVFHLHSKIIKKEGEAFIRFHRFYSSQYVLKEYGGISKYQFVFISLFHVLPFTIYAIFYKSYKKIYNAFIKKIYSLFKQYK
jgi:GT2 family glycosyltransferase